MADAWRVSEPSSGPALSAPVTLVEGSAFLICEPSGDVTPLTASGFFFRDSRFLSRWQLQVNAHRPELLAHDSTEPYASTLVARTLPRPGTADSNLMVLRNRYVGR